MNGSIRFAHVLSFVEFLVSLRYIRRPDDPHSFSARFASNLRGLKHPQQEIDLEYGGEFTACYSGTYWWGHP